MIEQAEIYSNKKSDSIFVSILGPTRVGKTTMLKSVLSTFDYFTESPQKGIVAVITKEKNKALFVEGTQGAFSMINLVKISDIMILLIDGFFGLELETFEVISLARINGVKKIFFVITHLDFYKKWKGLKKTKKRIKERLSKEINKQSKFFFLSGITVKNTYFSNEISNITRFIKKLNSLKNFTDPHILISRVNFQRKNKKIKTICLGHFRGNIKSMSDNLFGFVSGLGFFKIRKFQKFLSSENVGKIVKNQNGGDNLARIFDKNISFQKKTSEKKEELLFFFLANLELKKKEKGTVTPNSVFWIDSNKFQIFFRNNNPDTYIKSKSITDSKEKFKKKFIFGKRSKFIKKPDFLKNKKIKIGGWGGLFMIDLGEFPLTFKKHFDSTFPLIFSFPTYSKNKKTLIRAKINRHRWNKVTLCSGKLYNISMNLQFFKTKIFFYHEHSKKNRLLAKKVLKTGSSSGVLFYSFPEKEKTSIVGVNWDNFYSNYQYQGTFFIVLFSGLVLDWGKDYKILKKIKLKGKIYKYFKKTAFIKEMFSSEIQINRFKGSMIEQEEGNKGIIKKAILNGPKGSFRATFEKEIQKKKIVFLKIWIPVKLEKIYYPIEFFLVANDFQEIQGDYLFLSEK